jgi:beta-N-acetylhexosaminidase
MGYNIGNEQETKDLTKSIQDIGDIPFFIATDQEGGPVKRIWWDDTSGASAWDDMSDEDVCTLGQDRSKLLRSLGINVNFAPVVDLSYYSSGFINHRTISNDPLVVSAKASQFINCSQEYGIFTTLKHFPGHGATNEDSHYTLPIISKSKQDWLNSDAIPFYENLDSKFIMIGHLNFREIDDRPATLSSMIMKEIIREEFSYKGILISDDMNQLERSTDIDTKDAIIGSLNAGMDIVLYVGNPVSPDEMIDIISNAIKNGEISDIDIKLERILKTKREIY